MKAVRGSRQRVALRRRIQRVLRDRESGAAEIAAAATRVLADATALGFHNQRLERLKASLLRSHPAMASVWHAVHADNPTEFAAGLRHRTRETIRRARRVLPKTGTAVTISYSSSVIDAIARKGRLVYIGESVPGAEGVQTARALKRLGLRCEVIPDAALAVAAAKSSFGVIGADAVTPEYVVNKVGSTLLALACQASNIPFYVVADSSKFVSADWTVPAYDIRQPFETIPRSLVTSVISDGA